MRETVAWTENGTAFNSTSALAKKSEREEDIPDWLRDNLVSEICNLSERDSLVGFLRVILMKCMS